MESIALSIQDVQSLTGIKRSKIYQLLNSGALKARKSGRKTIILRADLEAFLNGLESYYTGSKP